MRTHPWCHAVVLCLRSYSDCIALWDVRTACEERQVLAELDGKVSVGNFGDFTKGEKPLVAGDIDGHVYIYDFVDKRTGMDLNMLYQDI